MDKSKALLKVYSKLARLDDEKDELRIKEPQSPRISILEQHMDELRKQAEEILNSPCPIVKQ